MRRVFILILDPKSISDSIIARIEQLGVVYRLFGNIIFLRPNEEELSNAQLVFNRLHDNNGVFPNVSVYQLSETDLSYWGYASRSLWEWLNQNRHRE